jgi:hypothetical protein
MKGVDESLARESPCVHKTRSQVPDVAGDPQDSYVSEYRQPTLG